MIVKPKVDRRVIKFYSFQCDGSPQFFVTNERIIKLDMPLQIDSEQKSYNKMNVILLVK